MVGKKREQNRYARALGEQAYVNDLGERVTVAAREGFCSLFIGSRARRERRDSNSDEERSQQNGDAGKHKSRLAVRAMKNAQAPEMMSRFSWLRDASASIRGNAHSAECRRDTSRTGTPGEAADAAATDSCITGYGPPGGWRLQEGAYGDQR